MSEQHKEKLQRICRICCMVIRLDGSYTSKVSVSDYKNEMKDLFGVDVSNETYTPPYLCGNCRRKLVNVKKNPNLITAVEFSIRDTLKL